MKTKIQILPTLCLIVLMGCATTPSPRLDMARAPADLEQITLTAAVIALEREPGARPYLVAAHQVMRDLTEGWDLSPLIVAQTLGIKIKELRSAEGQLAVVTALAAYERYYAQLSERRGVIARQKSEALLLGAVSRGLALGVGGIGLTRD